MLAVCTISMSVSQFYLTIDYQICKKACYCNNLCQFIFKTLFSNIKKCFFLKYFEKLY